MRGDDLWGLQVTEFGGPVTGGLRVLRVLNGPQQAASGGDGRIFGEAKSCQIGDAELAFEEPPGFIDSAGPGRDCSGVNPQQSQRGNIGIFIGGNRHQQLLEPQSSSHSGDLFSLARVEFKASGRDIRNCKKCPSVQAKKIVPPRIKQGFIGDGSWGQNSGDAAFDNPFGFLGIFELVNHRTAPALLEHGCQVSFESVVRNTGHGNAFRPLGEGNSQNPVGDLGIVVEEFVEVSHAEKEDALGVLGLDFEPLLHRRGLFAHCGCGLCFRNGNRTRGRI